MTTTNVVICTDLFTDPDDSTCLPNLFLAHREKIISIKAIVLCPQATERFPMMLAMLTMVGLEDEISVFTEELTYEKDDVADKKVVCKEHFRTASDLPAPKKQKDLIRIFEILSETDEEIDLFVIASCTPFSRLIGEDEDLMAKVVRNIYIQGHVYKREDGTLQASPTETSKSIPIDNNPDGLETTAIAHNFAMDLKAADTLLEFAQERKKMIYTIGRQLAYKVGVTRKQILAMSDQFKRSIKNAEERLKASPKRHQLPIKTDKMFCVLDLVKQFWSAFSEKSDKAENAIKIFQKKGYSHVVDAKSLLELVNDDTKQEVELFSCYDPLLGLLLMEHASGVKAEESLFFAETNEEKRYHLIGNDGRNAEQHEVNAGVLRDKILERFAKGLEYSVIVPDNSELEELT